MLLIISNKTYVFFIFLIGFFLMFFGLSSHTYILKSTDNDNVTKLNKFKSSSKSEYVVILHGIFVNAYYMHSLASYLANKGYEVINISYPSTKYNLEEIANFVEKEIKKYVTEHDRTVNFIGYSLGGVVLRVLFNQYRPQCMGRVVQIGTPNKGSEVADHYKNSKFFGWLLGPIIKELVTDQEHVKHLFAPVDYQLGIIASKKSRNNLFRKLFDGEHDGLVSVSSALLEGSKDNCVVDATHEFMPFNRTIIEQTAAFIEDGHFKPNNKPRI